MTIDTTSKESRAAFYNSAEWRAKRQEILERDHFECLMCKAEGKVTTVDHSILEVDHIKELVDCPELALDDDNLRTLCKRHHNERHERGFKFRPPKRKHSKWDDERFEFTVESTNVFLICGAPGSGKTAYVRRMKKRGDLVVDLDYINAALLGELDNIYCDHESVLPIAIEVRKTIYRCIVTRRGTWNKAYVVTSQPNIEVINKIAQELGAEAIFMDTSKEECIKRVLEDGRRREKRLFIELIEKWYATSSEQL